MPLPPVAQLVAALVVVMIGAVAFAERNSAPSLVSDDPTDMFSFSQLPDHHVPQVDWKINKVVLPSLPVSYRSRPAAFGPSTPPDGIWGSLAPISLFTGSDNLACNNKGHEPAKSRPRDWIALVERGECLFADKVRFAQSLGAIAVVAGDAQAELVSDFYFDFPGLLPDEDLGESGGRLITMRSDENTSDIVIPSGFVIRPSYLELLDRAMTHGRDGIRAGVFLDQTLDDTEPFYFGFFFIPLPAIIMFCIVLSYHIRAAVRRYWDRAPVLAIQRLPCYVWQPDGQWERMGPGALQDRLGDSNRLPLRRLDWVIDRIGAGVLAIRRLFGYVPLQVEDAMEIADDAPRFVDDTCPICLVEFSEGFVCVLTSDLIRVLPCGHVFHQKEVYVYGLLSDDWLGCERKYCPICKRDITER